MIKPEQWVRLEMEARECAVLATYVNYVKSGHQSREEALVAAAIVLSRAAREMTEDRLTAEQWAALEREVEASQCPVLSACLQHAATGAAPRGQALIAAAIELSVMRREMIAARERTLHAMLANETSHGVPAALRMTSR